MATALMKDTHEPRLEDSAEFVRTRDEMVAANRDLGFLEERWREVQRVKQGPDKIKRIDAELEERELEITIRRARASAERAREAHTIARTEAQQKVTSWHLIRIREAVPSLLDGVETLRRGPYAEVQRRIEAAIAAGVVPASLPLHELSMPQAFARVGGEVYVERCAQYLRRHGWSL